MSALRIKNYIECVGTDEEHFIFHEVVSTTNAVYDYTTNIAPFDDGDKIRAHS